MSLPQLFLISSYLHAHFTLETLNFRHQYLSMAINNPALEHKHRSPQHILGLLTNAAASDHSRGLHYLDNGISEAPITVTYAKLLEDATVSRLG